MPTGVAMPGGAAWWSGYTGLGAVGTTGDKAGNDMVGAAATGAGAGACAGAAAATTGLPELGAAAVAGASTGSADKGFAADLVTTGDDGPLFFGTPVFCDNSHVTY